MQIGLTVAERLVKNLLLRSEQIASAMMVRGFTSPNEHRVDWHQKTVVARCDRAVGVGIGVGGTVCVWEG